MCLMTSSRRFYRSEAPADPGMAIRRRSTLADLVLRHELTITVGTGRSARQMPNPEAQRRFQNPLEARAFLAACDEPTEEGERLRRAAQDENLDLDELRDWLSGTGGSGSERGEDA